MELSYYPMFKENSALHLLPEGGLIIFGNSAYVGINVQKKTNRKSAYYINRSAAEILENCNGTTSLNEIVKILNDKYKNIDCFSEMNIVNFIEKSINKEHLILNEKPILKKIRITGDKNVYFPVHIALEITDCCNLTCSHCYRNSSLNPKEKSMKTNKLIEILNEFAINGVMSIELTGGEPLLHPDFFDILDVCYDKFNSIGILTNGTLVTENIAARLAVYKDKLIMNISLDSYLESFHDKFRGQIGAFQKTTKAIKMLSGNGIFIRAAMSLVPENQNDVEQTLLLAKKLGAQMFGYSSIFPYGRGKNYPSSCQKCECNIEEYEKCAKYHLQIHEKYKDFLGTIDESILKWHKETIGNCGAGYKSLCVSPSGKIRICINTSPDKAIGDLSNEKYTEILKNQKKITFIMRKIKAPNENDCRNCENSSYCQFCPIRGVTKYLEKKNCNWAKIYELEKYPEIINLLQP